MTEKRKTRLVVLLEYLLGLYREADGYFGRAVENLKEVAADQTTELALYSLLGCQFDPGVTSIALGTGDIGLSRFANMGRCSKRGHPQNSKGLWRDARRWRVIHRSCPKTAFYKSFRIQSYFGRDTELSTCVLLGLYQRSRQRSSLVWCWFWPAPAHGRRWASRRMSIWIITGLVVCFVLSVQTVLAPFYPSIR
jgi:hypothetical protein